MSWATMSSVHGLVVPASGGEGSDIAESNAVGHCLCLAAFSLFLSEHFPPHSGGNSRSPKGHPYQISLSLLCLCQSVS